MSSEPFKEMAAEIDHNANAGFGGAFVIQPPGGAEALRILFLNPNPDPSVFWGTLKTTVDVALAEIAQQNGGFAPRR